MKKLLLVLLSLVLLTGCWDERQFKNIRLVLALGFDKGEEENILKTVSIPTVKRGIEGPGEETVQVVSFEAATPRDARDKIDQTIPESFDTAKAKVVLVGEELAKINVYPVLDEFYRNPESNLNSYLAVARGKASDIISMQVGGERVSKYISGILEGAIAATHTTGENLQLICAEMFEPGEDFSIPLLKIDEQRNVIAFDGVGLFHDESYTGVDISPEETTMFMLLQGLKGKVARITSKVSDSEEELFNYMTFHVMNLNQDLKVEAKGGEVSVKLDLKLKVRVVEYAANHIVKEGKIEELNKKLSENLTKDAEKIVAKMQEANSDIFAIGRRVHAYHPEIHKKLEWNEYYPTMKFTPKVSVEILEHGIIN